MLEHSIVLELSHVCLFGSCAGVLKSVCVCVFGDVTEVAVFV